jgi:hypothetical protein
MTPAEAKIYRAVQTVGFQVSVLFLCVFIVLHFGFKEQTMNMERLEKACINKSP